MTHDRYFLDNVAGWILEVDKGQCMPYQGNYTAWLEHKASRLTKEDAQEQAKRRRMEAELKFIRSQPKGNRGRDKGRIKKYDDLVEAAAASRDADRVQSGAIAIAPGPRLGGFVVRAERLTRTVGEADGARTLFSDLSFELPKGAIMGVIGGNGTGKTSLLRLIAGEAEPDGGVIKLGDTVKAGCPYSPTSP